MLVPAKPFQDAGRKTTPSSGSPVVTKRQSAMTEELDAGETAQDAGIAAVTAGEREFGEQLGNPLIENRAVIATGLVTQGTSKPRFAHASRPAQNQIVVRVDPLAIGELVEQSAVEAAWGPVIDVLDAGLLAQSGIAQPVDVRRYKTRFGVIAKRRAREPAFDLPFFSKVSFQHAARRLLAYGYDVNVCFIERDAAVFGRKWDQTSRSGALIKNQSVLGNVRLGDAL